MKKITSVYINPNDRSPEPEALSAFMNEIIPSEPLDSICWNQYPYLPRVHFRIGWCKDSIFLKFTVDEATTRAKFTSHNSPVHLDSCVEFFINTGGEHYYNFEFNPIGTCYLGYGTSRSDSRPVPEAEIVKTLPTLGRDSFIEESKGVWELLITIPLEIFSGSELADPAGKEFRCNFYKCGDELKEPHFITWNPVKTPEPDFHQQEFFGLIKFEPPLEKI